MGNKSIVTNLPRSATGSFSFAIIEVTNKKHVQKNKHATYWDIYDTVTTHFDLTDIKRP